MRSSAEVSVGTFSISASIHGASFELKLAGIGDMAAVDTLKQSLDQTREEVERLGLGSVSVDIRSLYLLNSSCIKAIVRFIYQVRTEGPQFPIVFSVDPKLTWQARALAALVRMAPELVSVQ